MGKRRVERFHDERRAAGLHLIGRLGGNACLGRTGVTMLMVSVTASNTTTTVGRTSMASGMPMGSGLRLGRCSINRTMS